MDAQQARRRTKASRVAAQREAKRKKNIDLKRIEESHKAGLANARKEYLPKVRKGIKDATSTGQTAASVRVTSGMFGPSDSPPSIAYYEGVLKSLKRILEDEGYTVQTSLGRDHYEPFGSDPICGYSFDYICPRINVRW